MPANPFPFKGLSAGEADRAREEYGINKIEDKSNAAFWQTLKGAVTEPMFLLLLACSAIYFILGDLSEAWFMLGAIIVVSAISFYQDRRSRKALDALQKYSQPSVTVIRDGRVVKLPSEDIVVGDYVVTSEGELIPADGVVKQCNDFVVNESILTGEAFGVVKDIGNGDSKVYSGTLVESGQCVFEVTQVGIQTRLGQIGLSIKDVAKPKTPLQLQISSFVRKMAAVGVVIFLLIWGINYLRDGNLLQSLLKGLTIAMSVLPEEIPVAFTVFMAIGAMRLMKHGIIVKETGTVESLGAATVLCADKTGTITENRMELHSVFDIESGTIKTNADWNNPSSLEVINIAMWASETVPFDPMEKALHEAYIKWLPDERSLYQKIHEYPLGGKPPMMTHIFENKDGKRIIAAKGAPEAIVKYSNLAPAEKEKILAVNNDMAKSGLRVLGVAIAEHSGNNFPETQQGFNFRFLGLVGFYDPPRKNMEAVLKQLYAAGIKVKIITGDNPATTTAIAQQLHFSGSDRVITGAEMADASEVSFNTLVKSNNIFARMFPEMKLRVVNSLKEQGEIVGMTGDGVNDGPALKTAHIGIAMGGRGSEIARQASSLIITDDDFGKMVIAVAMGRRIYTNLKKAIQYIISIHIPIILTVAIPSILGWRYPSVFTPVHVIFLELIMGPTCSIIYENEPIERNAMLRPPRTMTDTFFNFKELTLSIFQGFGITMATIGIYLYSLRSGYDETVTRTMVFATLIFANIFLTVVNRSFYYSVFEMFRYKNNLLAGMLLATVALSAAIFYIPVLSGFFQLSSPGGMQLLIAGIASFISVMWFEVYKIFKRR